MRLGNAGDAEQLVRRLSAAVSVTRTARARGTREPVRLPGRRADAQGWLRRALFGLHLDGSTWTRHRPHWEAGLELPLRLLGRELLRLPEVVQPVASWPSMHVTRDALYEQVWTEPMFKVAERYGVSSSFLARVCERLKVPHPSRGHWARIAVGQTPERPPLPPAEPGDELGWWRGRRLERVAPALSHPPGTQATASTRRPKQAGPHPLMVGAREIFEQGPESKAGYLRPYKRNVVDIFVSRSCLTAGLETASKLFLALERRGHRVVLGSRRLRAEIDERESPTPGYRFDWKSWRPGRPTVTKLGTVPIGLTLYEISEEVAVEREGDKYDGRLIRKVAPENPPRRRRRQTQPTFVLKRDMPSGRLCLRAVCLDSRATWERRWPESRPGQLLGKARTIVAELEREAPAIGAMIEAGELEAVRRRQAWEIERRKLEQQEAERQQAEDLEASREELSEIVEAWGVARRIEDFFNDAERRAAGLDDEARERIAERLRLARELLGGVDALERLRSWRAPDER